MAKINKANYQGKSQQGCIVQYCNDFGSIDPSRAWNDLGISKLATRISEMIAQGYQFRKTDIPFKARFSGKQSHYTQYKLVGLPPV